MFQYLSTQGTVYEAYAILKSRRGPSLEISYPLYSSMASVRRIPCFLVIATLALSLALSEENRQERFCNKNISQFFFFLLYISNQYFSFIQLQYPSSTLSSFPMTLAMLEAKMEPVTQSEFQLNSNFVLGIIGHIFRDECDNLGGTNDGSCASGYGVCCTCKNRFFFI